MPAAAVIPKAEGRPEVARRMVTRELKVGLDQVLGVKLLAGMADPKRP